MKILVQGYTGSGKTTAAKIIASLINSNPPINCSDILIKDFAKEHNEDPNIIITNKNDYRSRLFLYGSSKQNENPAYPTSKAIEHSDVVTGVRRPEELNAVRHLFDKVIWIERDSTKPNNTDQLGPECADIIVDNNGTIKELKTNLISLFVE